MSDWSKKLLKEISFGFRQQYPEGANIPQAWASGSIFYMIRTILGLRADAPHHRLYVKPTLPDWLPDLELHHLHVSSCSLTLRFWREGKKTCWEVSEVKETSQDGGQKPTIEVMDEPATASVH